MAYDKEGTEVNVGDLMIFSAGKSVEVYEILKIKEDSRNSSWTQVYVDVGSSKKWKQSINGIKKN